MNGAYMLYYIREPVRSYIGGRIFYAMRHFFETISGRDAFREGGGRPLFALAAGVERKTIDLCPGVAVMEPGTRIAASAKEFPARAGEPEK